MTVLTNDELMRRAARVQAAARLPDIRPPASTINPPRDPFLPRTPNPAEAATIAGVNTRESLLLDAEVQADTLTRELEAEVARLVDTAVLPITGESENDYLSRRIPAENAVRAEFGLQPVPDAIGRAGRGPLGEPGGVLAQTADAMRAAAQGIGAITNATPAPDRGVLGESLAGLGRGTVGMVTNNMAALGAGAGMLERVIGPTQLTGGARELASAFGDAGEIMQRAPVIRRGSAEITSPAGIAGELGQSVPALAQSVGLGLATAGLGVPAAIAGFTAGAAAPVVGAQYTEAVQAGRDAGLGEAQAQTRAAPEAVEAGLVTLVTSAFPASALLGRLPGGKELLRDAALAVAKRRGVRAFTTGLAEGSQEVAEEIGQEAVRNLNRPEYQTNAEQFLTTLPIVFGIGSVLGTAADVTVGGIAEQQRAEDQRRGTTQTPTPQPAGTQENNQLPGRATRAASQPAGDGRQAPAPQVPTVDGQQPPLRRPPPPDVPRGTPTEPTLPFGTQTTPAPAQATPQATTDVTGSRADQPSSQPGGAPAANVSERSANVSEGSAQPAPQAFVADSRGNPRPTRQALQTRSDAPRNARENQGFIDQIVTELRGYRDAAQNALNVASNARSEGAERKARAEYDRLETLIQAGGEELRSVYGDAGRAEIGRRAGIDWNEPVDQPTVQEADRRPQPPAVQPETPAGTPPTATAARNIAQLVADARSNDEPPQTEFEGSIRAVVRLNDAADAMERLIQEGRHPTLDRAPTIEEKQQLIRRYNAMAQEIDNAIDEIASTHGGDVAEEVFQAIGGGGQADPDAAGQAAEQPVTEAAGAVQPEPPSQAVAPAGNGVGAEQGAGQASSSYTRDAALSDAFVAAGPGHAKFAASLNRLKLSGAMSGEGADLLLAALQDSDDAYLGGVTIEPARAGRGQQTAGSYNPRARRIAMLEGLARRNADPTSREVYHDPDNADAAVFLHEFGHYGFETLLTNAQRGMVERLYRQKPKSAWATFFADGLHPNPKAAEYAASTVKEFFSSAFAEYVIGQRVADERLRPLLDRLLGAFRRALERLRGRDRFPERLELLFQIVQSGRQPFQTAAAETETAPAAPRAPRRPPAPPPDVRRTDAAVRQFEVPRAGSEFPARPDYSREPLAGRTGTLIVLGNRRFEFTYEVVEADDLIPTHDARRGFAPNAAGDANERPYHDPQAGAPSRRTVQEIARSIEPDLLITDTPSAVDGPPVTTNDHRALGGNARSMAMQLAYRGGMADGYKTRLAERAGAFGLDPARLAEFSEPVLVRALKPLEGDLNRRGAMSRMLNEAMTTGRTAEADAASRGARLTPEMMDRIAGVIGEDTVRSALASPAKARTVASLMTESGAIAEAELPRFWRGGEFTAEGKMAVESMLLGAVVPDTRTISELPDSVRDVLIGAAGPLSRIIRATRGTADDFRTTLDHALQAVASMLHTRSDSIDQVIEQPTMLDEPWRDSPRAILLARLLSRRTQSNTPARNVIIPAIRRIADAVDESAGGQAMLGQDAPRPVAEILDDMLAEQELGTRPIDPKNIDAELRPTKATAASGDPVRVWRIVDTSTGEIVHPAQFPLEEGADARRYAMKVRRIIRSGKGFESGQSGLPGTPTEDREQRLIREKFIEAEDATPPLFDESELQDWARDAEGDEAQLFSRQIGMTDLDAGGFYSRAQRWIAEKVKGPMPAADLLRAMRHSNEVTEDELVWTGLADALEAKGAGRVTPEEARALIAEGRVQMRERALGGVRSVEHVNLTGTLTRYVDSQRLNFRSALGLRLEDGVVHDAAEWLDEEVAAVVSENNITDPAAEIDRITNIVRSDIESNARIGRPWARDMSTSVLGRESGNQYSLASFVRRQIDIQQIRKSIEALGPQANDTTKFSSFATQPLADDYTELLFQWRPPTVEGRSASDDFISSHWDQKNVIAHARFQTRRGFAAGRPEFDVFFVDEIQSDWHQAGQERGYARAIDTRGWNAVREEGPGWHHAYRVSDAGGRLIGTEEATTPERAMEKAAEREQKLMANRTVPDAPFKKTWHEMVFRRLVRLAAERGQRAIAWTAGSQQLRRYEMGERIEYLRWLPDTGQLVGRFAGGNQISEAVTADELPDWVGPDLAARMLDGTRVNQDDLRNVKFPNGLRDLYDRTLVSYANKFGKRFGARVEKIKVHGYETEADVRHIRDAGEPPPRPPLDAWSLPITDAMQDSVMRDGVHLFSRPIPGEELGPHRAAEVAPSPTEQAWVAQASLSPDEIAAANTPGARRVTNTIDRLTRQIVGSAQGFKRWAEIRLRTAEGAIRSLGGQGIELADDIRAVDNAQSLRWGRNMDDLNSLLAPLNRAERVLAMKWLNGRRPPLVVPDRLKRVADLTRDILDRDMLDYGDAGGLRRMPDGSMVRPVGNGKAFPEHPNDAGRDFLKRAQASNGTDPEVVAWADAEAAAGRVKTAGEAVRKLLAYHDARLRGEFAYFDRTRVHLPEQYIEWDPVHVLPAHLRQSALLTEGVIRWGPKFNGAWAKLDGIREQHGLGMARMLGDWFRAHFMGGTRADMFSRRFWGGVSNLQSITRMGFSVLSMLQNFGQRFTGTIRHEWPVMVQGFAKAPPIVWRLTAAGRAVRRAAVRAGAVSASSELVSPDAHTPFFKLTETALAGFRSVEAGNQTTAAVIAALGLQADLERLVRTRPTATRLGRLLEFAVSLSGFRDPRSASVRRLARAALPPETLARVLMDTGTASEDDIKRAMVEMVRQTQFAQTLATEPLWWRNSPMGRVFWKFKTFGTRQLGLIYRDVAREAFIKGNPGPLVRFSIMMLLMGELYSLARDLLYGKDDSVTRAVFDGSDQDAREWAARVLTSMSRGGAFGLVADLTYGIGNFIAGPVGGTLENLGRFAYSAAAAPLGGGPAEPVAALKEFIEREVPAVRQAEAAVDIIDPFTKSYRRSTLLRARAMAFKDRATTTPTMTKALGEAIRQTLMGFEQYPLGPYTLSYRQAAVQLDNGQVDDASEYLAGAYRAMLEEGKTPKEIRSRLNRTVMNRSPLGRLNAAERRAFLQGLGADQRSAAVRLEAEWAADARKAIRRAGTAVAEERKKGDE